MFKKSPIIIIILILICGIYLVDEGSYEYARRKEGATLKDIPIDDLYFGNYVSFYIDDYVKKEIPSDTGIEYSGVSQVYSEGNNTYDIYTVLGDENYYFQVMVKDAETLNKLKNMDGEPVYFEGYVVDEPFKMNKEWYIGLEEGIYPYFDNIISNAIIQQTDIPPVGYSMYVGIFLVILAVVGYFWIGGIKSCIPKENLNIDEYDRNYFSYNVRNEYEMQKETLIRLLDEQSQIKKTPIIWVIFLGIAIATFVNMPFVFKMLGLIPLIISLSGLWVCFINSGNAIAVYIAQNKDKRSVYLDIIECKRNIAKLEKAIGKLHK